MADILNLNKARKKKAREAAVAQADANRVKFGRTKGEKARDTALSQAAQRKLDQLRRESPADETPEKPEER